MIVLRHPRVHCAIRFRLLSLRQEGAHFFVSDASDLRSFFLPLAGSDGIPAVRCRLILWHLFAISGKHSKNCR